MTTLHFKQELVAPSPTVGNENSTEVVSNLPRRLESRSPSASATRRKTE